MNNHDNLSFWSKELISQQEIVIVGGGICGVTTAIFLKKKLPDSKIMILEMGRGTFGASVRNAGFACFGSVSEIMDDVEQYGWDTALETVDMRWNGLRILRSLVADNAMDYKPKGGIELFENQVDEDLYRNAIPQLNLKLAAIVDHPECYHNLDTALGKAIKNKLEGTLDPAKMMADLTRQARFLGVEIQYGVEVKKIDHFNKKLITSVGSIIYDKCIITNNAWAAKLDKNLNIKPARNHVLVTSEIEACPIDGAYHMDKGYVYFRSIGKRVLIGGARNIDFQLEETYDQEKYNVSIINKLKELLSRRILQDRKYTIEHTWTGIMGTGASKKPLIKKAEDGLYYGVKMGGMGVAIGSYVGHSIANMVANDA